MRTFKKLDKLKTLPVFDIDTRTEEQKKNEAEVNKKNQLIERKKEVDAESKRKYLSYRSTQSIIMGMNDSIGSFFVFPGSEKSSRNNSKSKKAGSTADIKILNGLLSTKTILNVELKIDDVEDLDDE